MKDTSDNRLLIFGLYVMTVIFIYIFCTTFISIPDSGGKYADMSVPFLLGSGLGAIVGFYFGSSEGSKAKSDTIRKVLDTKGEEEKPK